MNNTIKKGMDFLVVSIKDRFLSTLVFMKNFWNSIGASERNE